MDEKEKVDYMENGTVKISNEVLATIATTAANEVEGVVGVSSNLASGITELLGKKGTGKKVKVELKDSDVFVEMHLTLAYGTKINEVGLQVQKKVKEAIESMTDLNVAEVNIHVEGISRVKESKEE